MLGRQRRKVRESFPAAGRCWESKDEQFARVPLILVRWGSKNEKTARASRHLEGVGKANMKSSQEFALILGRGWGSKKEKSVSFPTLGRCWESKNEKIERVHPYLRVGVGEVKIKNQREFPRIWKVLGE